MRKKERKKESENLINDRAATPTQTNGIYFNWKRKNDPETAKKKRKEKIKIEFKSFSVNRLLQSSPSPAININPSCASLTSLAETPFF